MKEEIKAIVPMIRTITGRREETEVPESQVEDALCSGWLRAEDVPEEPRRRGRPAGA